MQQTDTHTPTSDIAVITHACTPHTLNALLDDLNALPDLQIEEEAGLDPPLLYEAL